MTVQIVKWGNSQGIRISRKMMELSGIGLDEEVEMLVEEGKIIIQKQKRHRTLEERASEYGGKLGPYTEYDWGEPAGREIW